MRGVLIVLPFPRAEVSCCWLIVTIIIVLVSVLFDLRGVGNFLSPFLFSLGCKVGLWIASSLCARPRAARGFDNDVAEDVPRHEGFENGPVPTRQKHPGNRSTLVFRTKRVQAECKKSSLMTSATL